MKGAIAQMPMLNISDDAVVDALRALRAHSLRMSCDLPAGSSARGRQDMDSVLFRQANALSRQADAIRDVLSAQAAVHVQDALRLLFAWPRDEAGRFEAERALNGLGNDADATSRLFDAANLATYRRDGWDWQDDVAAWEADSSAYKAVADALWRADVHIASGNHADAARGLARCLPQLENPGCQALEKLFDAIKTQIRRSIKFLNIITETGAR